MSIREIRWIVEGNLALSSTPRGDAFILATAGPALYNAGTSDLGEILEWTMESLSAQGFAHEILERAAPHGFQVVTIDDGNEDDPAPFYLHRGDRPSAARGHHVTLVAASKSAFAAEKVLDGLRALPHTRPDTPFHIVGPDGVVFRATSQPDEDESFSDESLAELVATIFGGAGVDESTTDLPRLPVQRHKAYLWRKPAGSDEDHEQERLACFCDETEAVSIAALLNWVDTSHAYAVTDPLFEPMDLEAYEKALDDWQPALSALTGSPSDTTTPAPTTDEELMAAYTRSVMALMQIHQAYMLVREGEDDEYDFLDKVPGLVANTFSDLNIDPLAAPVPDGGAMIQVIARG